MTPEKKKLAGRILMITSILLLAVNLILYVRGDGLPGLTAMGALFFILGVAASRGSKPGET
jgi:NADH:ubiquinone oxidoreductase subunit K